MSSIKLAPNASGTGALTIAAPNTNTDLTFNLGTALGNNGASALVSTDASGNLGLGVAPSAWNSTYNGFDIGGSSISGRTSTNNQLDLASNGFRNSGGTWVYKYTGGAVRQTVDGSGSGFQWYIAPSGTAGNAISFTQAMTLDASGNLLVGTTTSSARFSLTGPATSAPLATFYSQTTGDLSNPGLLIGKQDNNTTTSQVILRAVILSSGAGQGQINANGANALAFGTFSDRRLKKNITDLDPQLSNIMALRPVEFDYIESEGGGHQTGFIAQEMQQVYSDAVGEREDGMLTVSGWSKTEARLVKAIQEQQALITAQSAALEALTARITALEAA